MRHTARTLERSRLMLDHARQLIAIGHHRIAGKWITLARQRYATALRAIAISGKATAHYCGAGNTWHGIIHADGAYHCMTRTYRHRQSAQRAAARYIWQLASTLAH